MEKWFITALKKIAKYNDYPEDALTVEECDKMRKWTPTDLIIREYLNNGGGSARGFLGISTTNCIKYYDYIVANQKELKELNYYNENGYNNSGFPLWHNYEL